MKFIRDGSRIYHGLLIARLQALQDVHKGDCWSLELIQQSDDTSYAKGSRWGCEVATRTAFTEEDLANTAIKKANTRGLEVAVNPARRAMAIQIDARYNMHSKPH